MLWAEHVAKNTARERDDVFNEVARHFNDAELVELTGVCGLFAFNNRFQDSMRLPIEETGEVDKIRASARADPHRLKTFVESLYADWPQHFVVPDAGTSAIAIDPGRREGTQASSGARVPLLDPAQAFGETAAFFDATQRFLEAMPNAVRLWAHIPHVAKMVVLFWLVLERTGAGGVLTGRIKVLALIRTSYVNACDYSLAHYAVLGARVGVTTAQSAVLGTDDGASAACFSPAEKAAIAWAGLVALNTAKRRDDAFAELKLHFDDAEVVELTGTCALCNMLNLVHNALRVPAESAAEIAAFNRSMQIDAARVKAYIGDMLADWPLEFPVPDAGARG